MKTRCCQISECSSYSMCHRWFTVDGCLFASDPQQSIFWHFYSNSMDREIQYFIFGNGVQSVWVGTEASRLVAVYHVDLSESSDCRTTLSRRSHATYLWPYLNPQLLWSSKLDRPSVVFRALIYRTSLKSIKISFTVLLNPLIKLEDFITLHLSWLRS